MLSTYVGTLHVLMQVDRHFDSLSGSCEWANAMVKSSAEFKVLWANIALTYLRPLSTISSVPPMEVVDLRPTPTRLNGRNTHLGHTVPREAHQDRTLASGRRRDSCGAVFEERSAALRQRRW